jgi:hypothetical protein
MDHICFDIICIMYFGSFGRILEHFVNFLKWPEKKFEVIFRSIFRPLFLYLLEIYYMSHQYGNKSKSQFTSPTPAQLPAVAVSTGHIWPVHLVWMTARLQQDTFLSWHLAPASEVAGGHTLPF